MRVHAQFDGRSYSTHGDVTVIPPRSRVLGGTAPPCDDGDGEASPTTVPVRALAGFEPAEAVVIGPKQVFIADGRKPFPKRIRTNFDPVESATDGDFRIQGQWTAVSAPRAAVFNHEDQTVTGPEGFSRPSAT